jgi:trehalose 6-phosphate synthase
VAAQDRANPGVLVLSEFAGASAELDRALIVNPHQSEAVAAALKQALEMPLIERQRRHDPMMDHWLEHDIDHWAEEFLSALGETRQRSGLLESLRGLFAVSLGG